MDKNDLKKEYKMLLIKVGLTEGQLAAKSGISQQSLNQKINRGSIKFLEFANILDTVGYTIKIEQK